MLSAKVGARRNGIYLLRWGQDVESSKRGLRPETFGKLVKHLGLMEKGGLINTWSECILFCLGTSCSTIVTCRPRPGAAQPGGRIAEWCHVIIMYNCVIETESHSNQSLTLHRLSILLQPSFSLIPLVQNDPLTAERGE